MSWLVLLAVGVVMYFAGMASGLVMGIERVEGEHETLYLGGKP